MGRLGRAAILVLAAALLPLAGCAQDGPSPPSLHAFRALYAPLEASEPGATGFSVELAPAVPHADALLVERSAYVLTFSTLQEEPMTRYALDGGFRVVRESHCTDRDACPATRFTWPAEPQPTTWGIGWSVEAPEGAERQTDGDDLLLSYDGVDYRFEPGRLAPSRLEAPDSDGWGYRLLTYEVTGALGPADRWPDPTEPLANATRGFLVHPEEDQDVMGLGWTTKDAMDHLATHPEAGAILDNGGCVLSYAVWDSAGDPVLTIPLPQSTTGDQSIHVALQDRKGQSTRWWFMHQTELLGEPRFSEPEGEGFWPFSGEVSCEERSQAPAPRLSVAEAWKRSRDFIQPDEERGLILEVTHQPPDPSHGGIGPHSHGLQLRAVFFPAEEGSGSLLAWDLWRGALVEMTLAGDDGPAPA